VTNSLANGVRHIDCAAVYGNEDEIGDVLQATLKEGKIKREDIFITSKVNARNCVPANLEAELNKTLADLKLTYLDLYLIHQPIPCEEKNGVVGPRHRTGWGLQDVWRAMEALYATGKVKAIGVSNYPTVLINDLLCYAKIIPAVHQIERHPYLVQQKHVDFCRKQGIQITAYASLGSPGLMAKVKPTAPELLKAEPVCAIAKKYGKTPAQVLIRWSVDSGIVSIPKSVKVDRVIENFSVWDFKLTPEDMASLSALDQHLRLFEQDWHTVPTFT